MGPQLTTILALLLLLFSGCRLDTNLDPAPEDAGLGDDRVQPPIDAMSDPDRPDTSGSDAEGNDAIDAARPDTGTPDVGPTDVGVDATPADAGTVECPPDDALEVCLLFDGNLVDSSGHGRDASSASSRTENYVAGRTGMAVDIEAGLRLILPTEPALVSRPSTLEAWFRVDSYPSVGRGGVVDKEGTASIFLYGDGRIRGSGTARIFREGPIPMGVWHHAAVTEEPGVGTTFFFNGIPVGPEMDDAVVSTPQPWHIGHNDNTSGGREDPLPGAIDSLRIWSRALTEEEIRAAAGL